MGLLGGCGWDLPDFDVAKGDAKAVVLQEQIAVVGFAEVGIDMELAGGDEGSELGGIAVVLEDFDTVQPVLSVGSADDDSGGVPLPYRPNWLRSCCGDQVVKGGHSAVAIQTFFGVGVDGIVQDLVLEADVGTMASVARSEGGVDEVLDAGVCARSNAEVDGELEVRVLACGEDVAGVAAFFATALSDGEEAVFDLPSVGGKVGTVGAVPA